MEFLQKQGIHSCKKQRDEDTPDSLFVKAETNYANGEYKKAADRFARIYDSLAESVDRDEKLLARKSLRYAGTAYYMAGEYQMAIESVAEFRTAFGEDEELSQLMHFDLTKRRK